jgi:hypothetical protein
LAPGWSCADHDQYSRDPGPRQRPAGEPQLPAPQRRFRATIIANADPDTGEVVERVVEAGAHFPQVSQDKNESGHWVEAVSVP